MLPPTALLRRLEHTVLPRPAGLLWWLGIRRLPCWGRVQPATNTFWARMPWGRSDGPVIKGHWQAANPDALPLAGTTVQLTIRLPLFEMLGGSFMLLLLVGLSLLMQTVVLASITSLFALFFITDTWWSIRRAEHHFQDALALERLVAEPV